MEQRLTTNAESATAHHRTTRSGRTGWWRRNDEPSSTRSERGTTTVRVARRVGNGRHSTTFLTWNSGSGRHNLAIWRQLAGVQCPNGAPLDQESPGSSSGGATATPVVSGLSWRAAMVLNSNLALTTNTLVRFVDLSVIVERVPLLSDPSDNARCLLAGDDTARGTRCVDLFAIPKGYLLSVTSNPMRRPLHELRWLLGVALGCGLTRVVPAQAPSPSRLLLDSVSAPAFSQVQMHCRVIGIQEFYSLGMIVGCIGKLSDTLFIAYKAHDGEPLAITKQFFVERLRLSVVGDSVRIALSKEFGPAHHCPQTTWTGNQWDSWQWRVGPTTIQLALNAQKAPSKFNQRDVPWVGVQFAQAALACGDWLPVAVPTDRVRH